MIELFKNNKVEIDIRPYLQDRGWEIVSPSVFKHSKPNSGDIEIVNFNISTGVTYEVSYTVSAISSGVLIVSLGGGSSPVVITTGYKEHTLTAGDNSKLKFYSDGDVTIENLSIKILSGGEDTGRKTVTWSDQRKGWVTFKDMVPEGGFSMFTNLFTFKEGQLWIHSVEDTTPNNFYGVQYFSKVKFPISSVGVKSYHSVAIHSNKVIGTSEDGIETQLGHVSDLITFDFNTVEGIHYANLLRDKYTNDKLKGRYIVLELTDEESKDTHLQIFKTIIKSNISTVNE